MMSMDFDTTVAYQIAERMMRSALHRGCIYYALTEQDREDLLQEAVTEMWRAAVVSGRTDSGWLAGAARQAIFRFTARLWFGRNSPRPGRIIDFDDDIVEEPSAVECGDDEPSPELEAILPEVWQQLYAARRKRGARGEMATDAEVAVLYLVLHGYSTTAIAVELGMKEHTVKIMRARLRRKLRAWIEERTEQHENSNQHYRFARDT